MESEAIKFDEYLANNLEKRFEFLYENYSNIILDKSNGITYSQNKLNNGFCHYPAC